MSVQEDLKTQGESFTQITDVLGGKIPLSDIMAGKKIVTSIGFETKEEKSTDVKIASTPLEKIYLWREEQIKLFANRLGYWQQQGRYIPRISE